jgi:hypothetical protein
MEKGVIDGSTVLGGKFVASQASTMRTMDIANGIDWPPEKHPGDAKAKRDPQDGTQMLVPSLS